MTIYRPARDLICLYVTEDQLGQEAADVWPWPTWKVELVHEMLHEWEHKGLAAPTGAGEALWRANPDSFGSDHMARFFRAIADKAPYFGLTPEQLIANL
jgi:hypothetical protein